MLVRTGGHGRRESELRELFAGAECKSRAFCRWDSLGASSKGCAGVSVLLCEGDLAREMLDRWFHAHSASICLGFELRRQRQPWLRES
jgi:hypothetical protein